MIELSATAYLWIKALHVISVIAWMAGLLYLPRLFVYHAAAKPGSEHSETLKVMERRLLRAIMNPAMLASLLFGGLMLADRNQALWQQGWMLAKLVLIAAMMGLHMAMSRWRRDFALDRNTRSQLFYRVANEAPTVLMIGVVVLAIAKPF
ncbi:MAG: TIGR00701 family protein [Rhodospirillales bacterium RIFCSPLOWO2_01_FULL_65_14]|nr:MAG: TIGR00701 family protein [Rhodospirillales bacterium RIFCSPLOWO2_01_FULL_65_14]